MKRIKATILVRTPDDVWRRVGKIIGYNYDPSKKNSDGGFCFCLPSHTKLSGEASGLLEKTGRVTRSTRPTRAIVTIRLMNGDFQYLRKLRFRSMQMATFSSPESALHQGGMKTENRKG